MENPAKTIRGHNPAGEVITTTLGKPVSSVENPDWVCTIHCPALFADDKSVAGVDADQALELAEMLVMELFDHRGIKPI